MAREEERRQAANSFAYVIRDCATSRTEEDFVQGALWADEHPRKGLVDIEKVCEWLALNAEVYGDINRGNLNIMINIFKKDMEK